MEQQLEPSRAATKVMQCTHLRELLQSFADYPQNDMLFGEESDEFLRGGWKLAHMSKLHGYDRSKLIGPLNSYSLDDFRAYLRQRLKYIWDQLIDFFDTSADKLVELIHGDFTQIATQLTQWLDVHQEELLQAEDQNDELSDRAKLSYMGDNVRFCLLHLDSQTRSLPMDQRAVFDQAFTAPEAMISAAQNRLLAIAARKAENTNRVQIAKLAEQAHRELETLKSIRVRWNEVDMRHGSYAYPSAIDREVEGYSREIEAMSKPGIVPPALPGLQCVEADLRLIATSWRCTGGAIRYRLRTMTQEDD
jgi:hypothetical protein